MAFVVFYDGCHKIYYAHDSEKDVIERMLEYGYEATYDDVTPLEVILINTYEDSCGLRFISPASLDENMPHISQLIDATEDDIVTLANQLRATYSKTFEDLQARYDSLEKKYTRLQKEGNKQLTYLYGLLDELRKENRDLREGLTL